MTTVPQQSAPPRGGRTLLGLLLAGAAVSVLLGVYGRLHPPTGIAVNLAGFSGPLEAKSWLASVVVVLAVVQLGSALVLYGRVPGVAGPSWTGTLHRWSGRAAFLLAVPVAVHCLYALGFQSFDARTLLHSLAGCAFFGAFTVKMLVLTRHGLAGWVLPVAGGVVFGLLVLLWLTSSLWFFSTVGGPVLMPGRSRRAVLAGGGAALLAGCATYGDEPASPAASPPASGAAGDEPLAGTAEVPVGGGTIKGDVVVTQPEAGTFTAFSTTCTHQGCKVTGVSDGEITCPCHGSAFAIADGSPVRGPATRLLAAVPVAVDGDQLRRA